MSALYPTAKDTAVSVSQEGTGTTSNREYLELVIETARCRDLGALVFVMENGFAEKEIGLSFLQYAKDELSMLNEKEMPQDLLVVVIDVIEDFEMRSVDYEPPDA